MKNWIKIYNESFENLSPEELYLYAYLYRRRMEFNEQWILETNLYLIESTIKCKFECKKRELKDYIKNMLINLKNKNYIDCNVNKNTRPNDLLMIRFIEDEKGGFSRIDYSLFDLFDDCKKFYIYCYIERFGSSGVIVSIQDWMNMLNVSKNTILKIIKEMNNNHAKPRIYKFSGTYSSSTKQEKNKYYTRPSRELIALWNSWYEKNKECDDEEIMNAVSYEEDADIEHFIPVDASNVDQIDFSKVKQIMFWNNENDKSPNKAPIERLACKIEEEPTKEMLKYAIDIYVNEYVKKGVMFTSKEGIKLQNMVKEKFKKQDYYPAC